MAKWHLLFVSISLERGSALLFGSISCIWWHIFFLRDFPALQIEQSIHGALAIPQDVSPSPIPGAENLAERHGLTGEVGADCAA